MLCAWGAAAIVGWRKRVRSPNRHAGEQAIQLTAILIALGLVGLSLMIHYEVLRLTSLRLRRAHRYPRAQILIALVMAMISHLLHVLAYAGVFYLLIHSKSGWGTIFGDGHVSFFDAFYFSITSYTTLGIGDLVPTGPIRLIAGIEALNGLVMVTWSASFTYIVMEKFWQLPRAPRRR